MAEEKLTPQDYRTLHYFHFEKGDITRIVDWPRLEKLLAIEHPHILRLHNAVVDAERNLDNAMIHFGGFDG